MWSFLNPAALFGLFAAGIPIILHLLSRRRVKVIEFSSIAFLNKMKQSRLRYVRLKELLLLAIRTLIIAFLVLGFSRPTYKGTGENAQGPTSTIVLLDDSYSMSRQTASGTLFELAKSKAMEITENMSSGDRIAIIPFSKAGDARYRFLSPDPSYFSRQITEYAASPETTVVVSAIKEAVQLLGQSANLNRELVIVSDFGACGWTSMEAIRDALRDFEGSVLLTAITWEENDNAYVTGIDYGGRIIQPGVSFEMSVTSRNSTGRNLNGVGLDLYLDKKRISQGEISLKPNETAEIQLKANAASSGIHFGFVELQDDEILMDNKYYFTFKVPENIKILLAGSDDELSQSIRLALSPLGAANTHLIADYLPLSKVASLGIGNYDAVIIAGYLSNPALVTRISAFLKEGHGVFIMPAPGANILDLSSDLEKLGFPAVIDKEYQPGSEGSYRLESIDVNHPIFMVYRNLKSSNSPFKIPVVNFRSIYNASAKGNLSVLASVSGNKPLLMIREKADFGGLIFSLASFSPQFSDITSSSMFLPMIQRISEYLAAKAGSFSSGYYLGEIAGIDLPADTPQGNLEIITPSGESFIVQPRRSLAGNKIIFEATHEVGIYFLKSGDMVLDAFAVNINTRESEPGKIDAEQLAALLPQGRLQIANQNENIAAKLGEFRKGREFTITSFGIVLFLLALEMAVAGRWRVRKVKS